ncbi:DUF116 domain-containing protein [Methanocaldococcus indicus]|uniref:DUF116 domain-containing protein n=1 Tax=Methanocaldococcus indicus TaxID=213231 RepID=UPI003C6D790F
MTFLEILGLITLIFIIILLFSLILILIIGFILIKKKKLILPELALYIFDTLYSFILKIFLYFGSEDTFYHIGVEFYNKYYEEKYKQTKKRILILPHCLRAQNCPAKLNSNGIDCIMCGKCSISTIYKVAIEKGYKVYIIPGSTFVKRIIKLEKPEAVFGVACNRDLFFGMNMLSRKKIIPQGQPLLKDGCINTIVDVDELIRRL